MVWPRVVQVVRTCTVRPVLVVDHTVQCAEWQLAYEFTCNFSTCCFCREGVVEVHVERRQVVGGDAVVAKRRAAETETGFEPEVDGV